MDKLIINTAAAEYQPVICAFLRAGFSVDEFAISNDLLIVEISSYQDAAVSTCNITTIIQSIYEITTALRIDNITMQQGQAVFAINDNGCYATTDSVSTIACVYDDACKVIVNSVEFIRAEQLAQCYAIVQAEQLAEHIAFNIHFTGCKKRLYHIDYAQYDAVTLRNTLFKFGIKSYTILHTRNLVIV